MKRLAVLALLPLGACAALGGGRPQIENRFARQMPANDIAVPRVAIDVTTSAVEPPATSVTITQLGDRAQAALIQRSAGAVPVMLKAAPKPPSSFALHDRVTRHIVVAVRPLAFLDPGDRVDAVRISLEVVPAQAGEWSITGWTAASNGQTAIDVGHLTETQSSKIGASAGFAAPVASPVATIAAEAASSRTREVAIRDTTDFDAAVDTEGRAWLDETAGWRVSLAHNLSLDAVVTAAAIGLEPVRLVSIVYPDTKPGAAASPAARLVETTVYAAPAKATAPICGRARLTYRIRHIVNPAGRRTFTEADDEIAFLTGSDEATFLLAPAPYEPTYEIIVGQDKLYYQGVNATPEVLAFATLEEATTFRDWLRHAGPGGGLAGVRVGLGIGGGLRPLGPRDLALLVPGVSNAAAARDAAAADAGGCRALPPANR